MFQALRTSRKLFVIIAMVFFSGCGKSAKVKDVTAPEVLGLSAKAVRIQAFSAQIDGWLDGEATLRGLPVQTEDGTLRGLPVDMESGTLTVKGKVALTLDRRDWYSTNMVIHYEPKTVKRGHLKIRYRFYDY